MSKGGGTGAPRPYRAAGLALAMSLAACSGPDPSVDAVDVNAAAARAQADIAQYAAANTSKTEAHGTSQGATETPATATALVDAYFAAIGDHRYAAAWGMWRDHGRASGMSEQAFAGSFAKYASYRARVGPPGAADAGAGQVYVSVPVRVAGTLTTGAQFVLEGPVVLHRVNDGIESDDPRAHRWQIHASALKPRPPVR